MCSDFASELPEQQRRISIYKSRVSNIRDSTTRRFCMGKCIPSNEGRLGEIISLGEDETAALPFEEPGLAISELLIGLDDELDSDVLYELSAASRLRGGIGFGTEDDIVAQLC